MGADLADISYHKKRHGQQCGPCRFSLTAQQRKVGVLTLSLHRRVMLARHSQDVLFMSGTAARQPVDLEHLAQYTGGEADLNVEVLDMFVRQCAQSLIRLHAVIEAADVRTWCDILHALKGSALGVGAFPLAEELATAEAINPELAPSHAAAALESLTSGSNMVGRFVAAYRRR
jgi:HPt (histidine-containing phosphotransfer) domain-containing protein